MKTKDRPEPRRGPARYVSPYNATDRFSIFIEDLVIITWLAGQIGWFEIEHRRRHTSLIHVEVSSVRYQTQLSVYHCVKRHIQAGHSAEGSQFILDQIIGL